MGLVCTSQYAFGTALQLWHLAIACVPYHFQILNCLGFNHNNMVSIWVDKCFRFLQSVVGSIPQGYASIQYSCCTLQVGMPHRQLEWFHNITHSQTVATAVIFILCYSLFETGVAYVFTKCLQRVPVYEPRCLNDRVSDICKDMGCYRSLHEQHFPSKYVCTFIYIYNYIKFWTVCGVENVFNIAPVMKLT